MADPLSLAASVAGLVSLGLQVTSGIAKYLDAVKCRDEELSEIRRQNGLLNDTLNIIEKTATQLHQIPPEVAAVTQRSIELHQGSLNALEGLISQLASSDVSTWKSRLKDKAGKLQYAFDRPKLQQLCRHVTKTQSSLQLALNTLDLSLHVATHGLLQSGIGSMNHQLDSEFQVSRSQLSTSTRILSGQLCQNEETLQTSFNSQHNYLDRIQGQNSDLVGKVAAIEQTLQALTANLLGNAQSEDQTPLLKTVTHLVAKPAVLRDCCDILPTSHNYMLSNFKTSCVCGRRKQSRRNNFQLGSWYLYSDLATEVHPPYCPMSRRVASKKERRYGMRYIGLTRVIKAAIEVAFYMRSEAGGWSVGPSFTYYPTVDEENDQTFQIIDIIRKVCLLYGIIDEQTVALFYQKALGRIVRLLTTGKTSPLAVNHNNQSLMHAAFYAYDCFTSHPLVELVQTLVLHGVPPISYDIRGRGPGFFKNGVSDVTYIPRYAIIDGLAMLAEAEGGTMMLTLRSGMIITPGSSPYHEELALSPSLAEACGCGPLSMAILAKDAQLAQSLLEKYPTSIEEANLFGHTPLHIAASQNGLTRFPFVLEAAKAAGLLQREDSSRQTALFAAFAMTGRHCRTKKRPLECTQCNCIDSMMMLLEAGSVVCDADLSQLHEPVLNISLRGWRAFLTQLKAQRESLKELALRNTWAVEEYLDVLRSGQVLDLHAYAVYKNLRRHGIDVPMDSVSTDYTNTGRTYPNPKSEKNTVYDCVPFQHESICELLFEMGFQDIDFDVQYGLPPLCRAFEISHINWFIQRGADLKRRIWPSNDTQLQTSGIFSAHYVLYHTTPYCLHLQRHLIPLLSCEEPQTVPATNKTLSVSLAANLTDSCCCACSTKGCTPYLFLFKSQGFLENQSVTIDLRSVADMEFAAIFDGLSTEIVRSLFLAAMRFQERYETRDQDEVDEIQEEEKELIKVLNGMVTEFQDIITNFSGDLAQSNFQACWKDYWTDRVPEILQELDDNRMTETERQQAELIGVVWKSETEEPEDVTGNPYDPKTIDYWYYKLDSITEYV